MNAQGESLPKFVRVPIHLLPQLTSISIYPANFARYSTLGWDTSK